MTSGDGLDHGHGSVITSSSQSIQQPNKFRVHGRGALGDSPVSSTPKPLTHAPQPFLHTAMGTLPPEIREVIWKYVLSSQGASILHNSTDSPEDLTHAILVVPLAGPLSTAPQGQNPCPALLKICRLVYQEARPIYFANNRFRFSDAASFLRFLVKIGPDNRGKITFLHLGGLLHEEPIYTEEEIDEECRENNLNATERASMAARTTRIMHPSACEAADCLHECNHLRSIVLVMKVDEEVSYILFLLHLGGHGNVVIDFLDTFHWTVRWAPEEYNQWYDEDGDECWPGSRPDRSSWGEDQSGNDRVVEVDFSMMKERHGSS